MKVVTLVLRGWAVGLGIGSVLAWLTLGVRETARILPASVVLSLAGFSAVALFLYLPVLRIVARRRGRVSVVAAAGLCTVLGAIVVALIAFAYDGSMWWVMSYEKAFMFALLAVPSAVFGAGWARQQDLGSTTRRSRR